MQSNFCNLILFPFYYGLLLVLKVCFLYKCYFFSHKMSCIFILNKLLTCV